MVEAAEDTAWLCEALEHTVEAIGMLVTIWLASILHAVRGIETATGALSHDRIVHDLPAFFADVFCCAPFTVQYNLTGQPAMSVPLHMLDGLPIGTQIAGRPGGEESLLSLAAALESARPWRDTRPPVFATLSGASA